MNEDAPALYLASRSPRRAALLGVLGVAFEVVTADVDERALGGETPEAYTARVAALKAAAARERLAPAAAVLAADTTVSIDGELFGKPRDAAHARAMLRRLAGRRHSVVSAVVVVTGVATHAVEVATAVEFVPFGDDVIDAYWASGEPADKAGAYGIQGLGGALVRRIDGSPSAVVGLPLAETAALLNAAGIAHALSARAGRA